MLMDAVQIDTCPERDKCVTLLMDEMYIREDLVYEKHSRRMIGYSHLGDVNSQLTEFEKDVHCRASSEQGRALAKTIVVIMVRGLFFISDPPHLIKTMRNSWKSRTLWVYVY